MDNWTKIAIAVSVVLVIAFGVWQDKVTYDREIAEDAYAVQ